MATALSGSALATPTFDELDVVTLRRSATLEGVDLPAGAEGTIVFVHKPGVAYEVEFVRPIHAVVAVEHGMLARRG